MTNRTRTAQIVLIALGWATIGCVSRGPAGLSSPIHRITVDGRVVQSSARDLLELLQRYPIVQRMFEAALEGRSPLVVVDGVALVSPYRLADIRLIEVERVLLLRGAQAMMQYGARAAEGAIIVETRIRSPEPPPFSRGASGPGVSAGRTGR